MAPPIQPNNSCCQPVNGNDVGVDFDAICGGGWECPPMSVCMTGHWPGDTKELCACVTKTKIEEYMREGWLVKYVLARVDKPRREIAALTTPITPVFLQEFLGKLPEPPAVGFQAVQQVELSIPIRTALTKSGTPYNLGKPSLNLYTNLNNYYGNTNGMTLYWRWRLGLGNAYQSWWPYDASDFPEDWWLPDVTDSWNDFFAECGAAPPKGQGLCCEAQAICAAQKHHHLWEAVQRASERNMEQARKIS